MRSLNSWLRGGWRSLPLLAVLLVVLSSCAIPRVSAEERLFLDLSLDFLDAYEIPATPFEETLVGGLSGITYDRERDRFYLISDDRSEHAPARFYTVRLTLNDATDSPTIGAFEIEQVTTLLGDDNQPFAAGTIDPEGIALSPRQSVFVSSEGVARDGIPPQVYEFDLATGHYRGRLPIPQRFAPTTVDGNAQGIQDNRGFEALTLNPVSSMANPLEPFRLFTANETSLLQDMNPEDTTGVIPVRLLHYQVGDSLSTLLSEHVYLVDPGPDGALENGLNELLALDQAGHFLSLERSFSPSGFGVRLYQMVIGGATDTSGFATVRSDRATVEPVRKQLLLNLTDLGISLDNLEGITLGPRLPDGSQSLLIVSDNNFNDRQINQLLLFRLRSGH